MSNLEDFKCLVFDCYGTLVDWESGIFNALQPLLRDSRKTDVRYQRADVLDAFGSVETQVQTANPTMLYSDVLRKTHEILASPDYFDSPSTPEMDNAFGSSVANWEPFPDTVEALARLSKHYKLVILSNVDKESFSSTRQKLERGFTFSKILTAQEIGSYKPDIANFQYALRAIEEEFGIGRDEVLVTAQSLFHDHVPANKLGLRSVWISRRGSYVGTDTSMASFTWQYDTLGDMASAIAERS